MNHSFVFHWTERFISKCQLKNFCHFTFCPNTKAIIAFVFLGFFWGAKHIIGTEPNDTMCNTLCIPHAKSFEMSYYSKIFHL